MCNAEAQIAWGDVPTDLNRPAEPRVAVNAVERLHITV